MATRSSTSASLQQRREALFAVGSAFQPAAKKDIVGIDGVVEIADRLIHWLRNFDTYANYGARPEPGVVFAGVPGTGKTLVSRYIASASDALFIDVRDFDHEGSAFRDRDIAELFKMARETHARTKRPIVLFWDEFEGYADDRTKSAPDRAAVVSQLTSELDGSKGKLSGVLLIGCTNYSDEIDDALLRPGRMGLTVEFTAPDRIGKTKILEHYLEELPTADVDTALLGYFMDSHQTAASIEEVVQDAWRLAVKRAIETGTKPVITHADLRGVCLDRMIGPATSLSSLSDDLRLQIATHEVGHGLLALRFGVPVTLITIRPAGKGRFGQTQMAQSPALSCLQSYQDGQIIAAYGGLAAEEMCGYRGTGGSGDMYVVTSLLQFEVDESGHEIPLNMRALDRNRTESISPWLMQESDMRITDLGNRMRKRATSELMAIPSHTILELARFLMQEETLSGPEFVDAVRRIVGPDWESGDVTVDPGAKVVALQRGSWRWD